MANYFRYSVHENEDFEHAESFKSVFDAEDAEYLAVEAAEDYYNNRDGWESSWDNGKPFWLWSEDGKFIGRFTICCEYTPTFSATKESP